MKFCQVIIESHSVAESYWLPSTKQAKAFVKEKAIADANINAKIVEVMIPPGKKSLIAWLNQMPQEVIPQETPF
jgi:hypothetical protein